MPVLRVNAGSRRAGIRAVGFGLLSRMRVAGDCHFGLAAIAGRATGYSGRGSTARSLPARGCQAMESAGWRAAAIIWEPSRNLVDDFGCRQRYSVGARPQQRRWRHGNRQGCRPVGRIRTDAKDACKMTWPLLSVKIPPELHRALSRQGNVPLFVRQTLAAALGVEYQERLPGLAGATPRTRKRVSKAGVSARKTPESSNAP